MKSRKLTLRQMCLFSLTGSVMFVLKMAMAQIPNVEPVSLFVMLLAVVFGWKGLWALYVYVFLEYMVWGIHLWSICYLYVWLILFAAARACRKMTTVLGWALLGAFFGLLFGAFCSLVYWIGAGWSSALAWWISGIPFDVLHGLGNFFVTLLLWKPLKRLFVYFTKKTGMYMV